MPNRDLGTDLERLRAEVERLKCREREWDGYEQLHKRLTAKLADARDMVKRLQRYVAILTPYGERHHPLGASQDDCNDECMNAEAIRYGLSLIEASKTASDQQPQVQWTEVHEEDLA